MRRFLTPFFFLFFSVVHSQPNIYLTDLKALKGLLEKSASFRAQIKGDRLDSFEKLFKQLQGDSLHSVGSSSYFNNLTQLILPIKDNHIGFYQLPNYNWFRTKESIDSFIQSKAFEAFPKLTINTDSLKQILIGKSVDSIEGVYYYDKYYTIGVFKSARNEYSGVILDSEINFWEKGHVALKLYETGPNLFKAVYAHPYFKHFLYQPIEKYQNQSLINSSFYASFTRQVYSKQKHVSDYINLPKLDSKFSFAQINDSVQYLLIQSFQTVQATRIASQKFYDSIKNSLSAPYLILDLRNSEGGADSEMIKYLKLLKAYVKNGQLIVLTNNGTLSQAEIFTLELKKLKHVMVVGQPTKGMLAYGSNYGKKEKLPSGQYEVYLTDMNNGASLLPYEDVGIMPDIILGFDKDWIQQVLSILMK